MRKELQKCKIKLKACLKFIRYYFYKSFWLQPRLDFPPQGAAMIIRVKHLNTTENQINDMKNSPRFAQKHHYNNFTK